VNGEAYALGLDVGGTKIAAGVVALGTGEVVLKRRIPTEPGRGGAAVLADCAQLAGELLAEAGGAGRSVLAIGVGVAELVNLAGQVTTSHTIAWAGLPVRETLARLAPTVVDSDVRTAARAEAVFGAGRAFDNFLYLTIGTGISACLVQAGRPFAGARGNAVVLTSGAWTAVCPHCGAVTEMVVEEIASGPALVARYNAASPAQAGRGEEVLAAASAGDSAAAAVITSGAEALGNSLALAVNLLDPAAVVVGGGLGLAGGLYWERLVASTRRHIWATDTRELPILPAALGPDAGVVGAALTARDTYAT
jgi:glucokinase